MFEVPRWELEDGGVITEAITTLSGSMGLATARDATPQLELWESMKQMSTLNRDRRQDLSFARDFGRRGGLAVGSVARPGGSRRPRSNLVRQGKGAAVAQHHCQWLGGHSEQFGASMLRSVPAGGRGQIEGFYDGLARYVPRWSGRQIMVGRLPGDR